MYEYGMNKYDQMSLSTYYRMILTTFFTLTYPVQVSTLRQDVMSIRILIQVKTFLFSIASSPHYQSSSTHLYIKGTQDYII